MIDQLVYHYLETLLGNPVVKGAVLNIGLGAGYSARLLLGFRPVDRVTTLEIRDAVVSTYREKFPSTEPLELRHTIVVGDARSPSAAVVKAMNPPFDYIFVDTIAGLDVASYEDLKAILTSVLDMGILSPKGAIGMEWQADVYPEREARLWSNEKFNTEILRSRLSLTGQARAGVMAVLRPKS